MSDLRLVVVGSNPGLGISICSEVGDRLAGKLSWDVTTTQVNSALYPFGVTKSSTSFGWVKGGKVTSAGWQVADPMWYVMFGSGEVGSRTAISCLPLPLRHLVYTCENELSEKLC